MILSIRLEKDGKPMSISHITQKDRDYFKGRKPVALPSQDAISKAVEILSDQELHYYQLLFFNGLSNTNGTPFSVERKTYGKGLNHITTAIHIFPIVHPEYGFCVNGDMTDEQVLKNAQDLLDNIHKLPLAHSCCPLAVVRQCVCYASFDCPIHGKRCVGSHD